MKTDLKKVAELRGGDCLGLSKTNPSDKKYIWQCKNGHVWEARADHVVQGSWCPICIHNNQKKTIDEMMELAKKHDGECLSKIYVDARTKLMWKCNKGHIFETTPAKVKQGRWCWECGNQTAAVKRRTSIQEIQMIASLHEGKCLSKEYNPKQLLEWQCEFGHTWYANFHNVKSGSWCPVCGHKKSGRKSLSLEEMREIAKSRGGQCLSESYENVDSKLKWMCEKGHVWMALPSSVKKGSWCSECAGNKLLEFEQVQKIAIERGGICLSTWYEGVHKKLEWQCAEGHTWFAN